MTTPIAAKVYNVITDVNLILYFSCYRCRHQSRPVEKKLLNIGGIPRERERYDKVCTEPLDLQSLLIRKTKGQPLSTSLCKGVSP